MESLALHSLSSTATVTTKLRSFSFSFSLSTSHPPSLLRYRPRRIPSDLVRIRANHSNLSSPFSSLKPLNSTPPTQPPSPTSPPTLTPPPPPLSGAKPIPLILSLSVGLILRFLIPPPPTLTIQAWSLLSIFLSTVTGLILSPLPVGAWAFLGITATVLTRTLSFSSAFSAFTSEVIWLIVISFFFARGFVKTGLGDRIATYFVKWLGKSTLGLSYGLTISEALVAPAMPSTTARAGGIFLPIIKSLSLSSGSLPEDASSKKLGSYLVMTQFQVW